MYYCYIVRCSDTSLYCGQTNNLQRRIQEHNFDKNKSAKYLRAKKPVKLVYFEAYSTLKEAMQRERQIKEWTRAKKEALIRSGSCPARDATREAGSRGAQRAISATIAT
ncbi:MAG: GIY-YIG nuclease family protein [bacterium]|nr:GIY-YIG nuclease family protein [bacterium]